MLNESVSQQYSYQYSKKLEATENQLDQQQKKIETQLEVAQQQLQAVEQAEAKGIERSIPKYSGLS